MSRGVLLDLDGTLVDSAPLICAGLRASLEAVGLPVPPDAALRALIGLPLAHVWDRLGVALAQVDTAVGGYRAWLAAAPRGPAPPFPGIPELLAAMHADEDRLVLASAKDTASCRRHLDLYSWSPLFAGASGTEPGDGPDKRALVQRALAMLPEALRRDAVMVGDSPLDGDAAAANGIIFIAVGWGYGARDELLAQRPLRLVSSVAELTACLRDGR